MTPDRPCGNQRLFNAADDTPCTEAAGHVGPHFNRDYGAVWDNTPVSLQYDACGALLQIEHPANKGGRHTIYCALGVGHQGMAHRAADGTQWDTATPGAAGTVMDVHTARRYSELLRLVSPDDADALNLGPVIERQREADNWTSGPEATVASQADVLPLVREVMRLRRDAANVKAGEPNATARSVVTGLQRQIEHMTHVFGELLAATCTGCRPVALSSNPEDGADLETVPGCPVHGEVAELRRGHAWMLVQYERILGALGPEWSVPFPPGDPTAKAVQYIDTARRLDAALSAAGIEHPTGLAGVEDLVGQRDGHAEHAENCEAAISRIAELARDAVGERGGEDGLIYVLNRIAAECERGDR